MSRRPNRNNNKSTRRKPRGINEPITVRVKVPFTHTLTASAVQQIVELAFDPDTSASDLDTLSSNLSSFHDQYSYWRLVSASLEIRNQDGITVPAGGAVLFWSPPNDQGLSTLATSEGEFVSILDLVSGSNQLGNKLTLPVSALGQQTRWKLCHDVTDAPDTNTYGTFNVQGAAAFTASDLLLCLLEVTIQFRTLNDDTLGSSNVPKQRINPLVVTQNAYDAFSPSKKKLFLQSGGKITG